MKRSLILLISLLVFGSKCFVGASASAMDEPFDCKQANHKDLQPKYPDPRAGDPRYQGRSAIYESDYPKMVMVHPYNHGIMYTPFSAALPHAIGPHILEQVVAQQLAGYQIIYSFVVQRFYSINHNCALKPHYFAHPDAPTIFAGKDYYTKLRWTTVPGVEGQVEPSLGKLEHVGLLPDEIYTHQRGDMTMGVSGDVMHLNGFNLMTQGRNIRLPSKDMYSLVAFEDGNRKIAAITYHWLLEPQVNFKEALGLFELFCHALKPSNNLRELIGNLQGVEGFELLSSELKRYVGLQPSYTLNTTIYHLGIDNSFPYKTTGLSVAETTHRWTKEQDATLIIPEEECRRAKHIVIKKPGAFVAAAHNQSLIVTMNQFKIGEYLFDQNNRPAKIEVPIPFDVKGDAVVKLSMPHARSPIGIIPGSTDPRQLAISLNEIEVVYQYNPTNKVTYRLALNGDMPQLPCVVDDGFSKPEETHVWTQATKATMKLRVQQANHRIKEITFRDVAGHVSDKLSQPVTVSLNNNIVGEYNFTPQRNKQNISISMPFVRKGEPEVVPEISFELPNANPTTGDLRKLGFLFNLVDVTYFVTKS
jgi:hypothetical protein